MKHFPLPCAKATIVIGMLQITPIELLQGRMLPKMVLVEMLFQILKQEDQILLLVKINNHQDAKILWQLQILKMMEELINLMRQLKLKSSKFL